jgi:hypothetical protein
LHVPAGIKCDVVGRTGIAVKSFAGCCGIGYIMQVYPCISVLQPSVGSGKTMLDVPGLTVKLLPFEYQALPP